MGIVSYSRCWITAEAFNELENEEIAKELKKRILPVVPGGSRELVGVKPPEGLDTIDQPVFELTLYELLKAYGDGRRRSTTRVLTIEPTEFHSLDDAL